MESKKKLLIADADESFRSILMDAMRDEADMEVLAATGDGEEALRLVRELSPDVLLMDMVLARMDGLEVLSALEQASRPKVLWSSPALCGAIWPSWPPPREPAIL